MHKHVDVFTQPAHNTRVGSCHSLDRWVSCQSARLHDEGLEKMMQTYNSAFVHNEQCSEKSSDYSSWPDVTGASVQYNDMLQG